MAEQATVSKLKTLPLSRRARADLQGRQIMRFRFVTVAMLSAVSAGAP